MDANTTRVILALIGLVAVTGIAVTIRFVMKKKDASTRTKQTGNVVFGDQAGRDIKK